MNHPVISAVPRGETTKGQLNDLRLGGKIPAVVYGGGQAATKITLDAKEFEKATSGITESTILTLSVGGKQSDVFVKEHQRSARNRSIIHVDFLEVVKGRAIHARVPLFLVGAAIGVRHGGILENPAHEIEVECDSSVLPEKIEVDIANLDTNHSIHVRDLVIPAGVKVLTSADLVVAVVKFAKAEVVEAAPVAAAAAAPAAGAAPAAAPAADKKEEKK
jgi:large subunit ribosomal protein L25